MPRFAQIVSDRRQLLAEAFYKQLIAEDNQGVATVLASIGLPMCQVRDFKSV